MRFAAIAPLLFTIAAFVLAMLCIFAGSKPNFMQDYDIVTLNTSTLGYAQLEDEPTSSASQTSSASEPERTGGFRNWLSDKKDDLSGKVDNITDKVETNWEDFKDDLQNSVADKLAEKLGIEQWYNLHLMDMCMGNFSPNATDGDASMNVTMCSNRTAIYKFDPTSRLEQKLADGPLSGRVTLKDLGWPDAIQKGINAVNGLLAATFILYCIGIAFAGILTITSLLAIFSTGRLLSIVNLIMAFLSFLSLGIASAIITAFMVKVTDVINENGNGIGIYARKGSKFLAITWAATGVMFLTLLSWIVLFILGRKQRRRGGYNDKDIAVRG